MKGLAKWEEVELVEMIDMMVGAGAGEPAFAGRLTNDHERHGPFKWCHTESEYTAFVYMYSVDSGETRSETRKQSSGTLLQEHNLGGKKDLEGVYFARPVQVEI